MVDEFLAAKQYVLYFLSPELFTKITNSKKFFLKVTYFCLILRPVTLFSCTYNKQNIWIKLSFAERDTYMKEFN